MSISKSLSPNTLLRVSKKFWFISLLISQLGFVSYLVLSYGVSALNANIANWNSFNGSAYVENDAFGNLMYGLHVLLAIIMIVGGSLQLIPNIRQRFIKFHKINGRVFVVLACTISLAGLYLIIFRGTVGNALLHSLTAFSGCVVLASSVLAVKAARRKDIKHHQIWAIRLFLAANGVLFFRLIMFAWLMSFGTLGIDMTDFTGPTVVAISVSSYILPLLLFEWIRLSEKRNSQLLSYVSSVLLLGIGSVFYFGLFGIAAANWYPAISAS